MIRLCRVAEMIKEPNFQATLVLIKTDSRFRSLTLAPYHLAVVFRFQPEIIVPVASLFLIVHVDEAKHLVVTVIDTPLDKPFQFGHARGMVGNYRPHLRPNDPFQRLQVILLRRSLANDGGSRSRNS